MSEMVAKTALRLLQISVADIGRREDDPPDTFNAACRSERAIYSNSVRQHCDSLAPYTRKRLKGRVLNEAQTFWLH